MLSFDIIRMVTDDIICDKKISSDNKLSSDKEIIFR